jgi:pantoate kinase
LGGGYSPAHLTGIFTIHNSNPNPLKCGSCGVGICIDSGVYSYVLASKAQKQSIDVYFNGLEIPGNTTKSAIIDLINDQRIKIKIFSFSKLPISQGFGLSGAGALSSAIALNSSLNLDIEYLDLVGAAHKAEIINRTGLGDVVAQATGGLVLREKEGSLNYGKVKKIMLDFKNEKIFVCTIGQHLKTSIILSNKNYLNKINTEGNRYLMSFKNGFTMIDFFKKSLDFAKKTGLIRNQVLKVINKIHKDKAGQVSMIMLGNSIFGIGDIQKMINLCPKYSNYFICRIDPTPARIIL